MINNMVSIIVPVYKSEKYLVRLIESVLQQSYQNFELILVDDGSPDKSGDICDNFAKQDSRIVVVHKENGGCSEARNTGLNVVRGEYLTFIDGDDWMEPDCLEYLLGLIRDNDCEMSMSDCLMTTGNRHQNKKDNIRVLTSEEAICDIFYVKTPVGAWNKMYKTSIIKDNNIRFVISWFGEGLYFSSMAAKHSNKVAMGHRKVYGYRKNNPNSGTTVRKVEDGMEALNHSIFVRDKVEVTSKAIQYATDWHIWKNHFNLLLFILGSKARKAYLDSYRTALSGIRKMGFSVFIHSKVSLFQRFFIIAINLFPRTTAKIVIFVKNKRFKRDIKVID